MKYGEIYSDNLNMKLYAIWEINTYTITYDANGGNELEGDLVDPLKCTKTHGLAYKIPNVEPTRSSYTFKGWARTQSAADEGLWEYEPGGWYIDNEDVTLYAVWEGQTYTVIYDANGGTNAPDVQVETKQNSVQLSWDIPIRDGYEFLGWSTNQDATEPQYYPGDTYDGRTGIKLYAIWKKCDYVITYIVDGSEFDTQSKVHGLNIRIIENIPEREGYYFLGWSKTEDSTAIDYTPGSLFCENRNTALYAVMISNEEQGPYDMVEYNANGGEWIDENGNEITVNVGLLTGSPVYITEARPTRYGYDFMGWAIENPYATTPDYNSGDLYLENEGHVLYAVWVPNMEVRLIVYYYTDSGEEQRIFNSSVGRTIRIVLPGNQEAVDNAPEYITDEEIFALDDVGDRYTSVRLIEGDAEITPILAENESTIAAYDVTLGIYESKVYVATYYKLTYNANSTDPSIRGIPDEMNVIYGNQGTVENVLSSQVPTRTNYSFAGWSKDPTATTPTWGIGDNYYHNVRRDVTLYAVWQPITIVDLTVRHETSYSGEFEFYFTKYAGEKVRITLTEGTIDDMTDLALAADGSVYQRLKLISGDALLTEIYNDAGEIVAYDVTMGIEDSVVEVESYYELTYDANATDSSITGIPDLEYVAYGTTHDLSSQTPTRDGYQFLGWSLSGYATTAEYQPGGTFNLDTPNNVTLYAIWEQDSGVTVTVLYPASPSGHYETIMTNPAFQDTNPLFYVDLYCSQYNFSGDFNLSLEGADCEYQRMRLIEGDAEVHPAYEQGTWFISGYYIYPGSQDSVVIVDSYYKLTYDANTTDESVTGIILLDQYIIYKEDNILSSQAPSREGDTFLGWSLDPDATTADYQPGGTFYLDTPNDVTLYAVWEQESTEECECEIELSTNDFGSTDTEVWMYYISLFWIDIYDPCGQPQVWLSNDSVITLRRNVEPLAPDSPAVEAGGVRYEYDMQCLAAGKVTINIKMPCGKIVFYDVYVYNVMTNHDMEEPIAIYDRYDPENRWPSEAGITNKVGAFFWELRGISSYFDKAILKTVAPGSWYHEVLYYNATRSAGVMPSTGYIYINPSGEMANWFETHCGFDWTYRE